MHVSVWQGLNETAKVETETRPRVDLDLGEINTFFKTMCHSTVDSVRPKLMLVNNDHHHTGFAWLLTITVDDTTFH